MFGARARLWLLLSCLMPLAAAAQPAYPSNPLYLDASVYVSRQGVYRFAPEVSEPLWSSLRGVETFAPVAWRDLILVGSTQGLYALRRDSGEVAWRIEPARTLFSPSVADAAYAGSVHGELYRVDAAGGKILWRRQFPGWVYSPALDTAGARLWSGGQMHRIFALANSDGSLLQQLDTTQELVFSAVDIGQRRFAFNLFDGSSLVVDAAAGKVAGVLPGSAQPNDLLRRGDILYRSHRDGSLAAFDAASLELRWRKRMTQQDLTLHPARPGYLLMSDLERDGILLPLADPAAPCRLHFDPQLLLPLQLESGRVLAFSKQMQPPELRLVQLDVECK